MNCGVVDSPRGSSLEDSRALAKQLQAARGPRPWAQRVKALMRGWRMVWTTTRLDSDPAGENGMHDKKNGISGRPESKETDLKGGYLGSWVASLSIFDPRRRWCG